MNRSARNIIKWTSSNEATRRSEPRGEKMLA